MGSYTADLEWERKGDDFLGNRYRRRHRIKFDGGVEIPGSSSPHVVPVPQSDPSAVDPEEAFVASIASCHMLWFLSIASARRYRVDRYTDHAVGVMGKNATGKEYVAQVTLHPAVAFSGERIPTTAEIATLHHRAHEECFIANSVLTDIRCEPVPADAASR